MYSTFYDNVADRGVVFVIKNSVSILGNTTFRRSVGPALRVGETFSNFIST